MGYNRADLIRIKGEYHEKYLNARKLADLRCLEVYGRLPRVREIDKILSKTALEIMSAATSGDKDEIENIKKRNGILVAERERLLIGAGYPKDYKTRRLRGASILYAILFISAIRTGA